MIAICSALSSAPPSGGFYPYVGHTWGVAGFDFTWYNHAVGPNAATPDCTSNRPIWRPGGSVYQVSFFGVHKASSNHSGGVNVGYLDGSVKLVTDAIDLNLWRALASIAGREVTGPL